MHVIKKLAGCIREYKLQTILSPLFIALEVLIEVMIPFITAKLIDSIEAQATIAEIARHGGILVLLAMLSLVCGALSGHFCAVASSGFAKNLRHDLFYKVQSYSFSNIDKFSTSSLVTRLTTDVTNVQNSFMMVIRTAIRSPMMLAFSVIMTMRISKKLTLVFLTTIPFLAVGLTFMLKKVMPFFKKIFKKYDALNNSVQENISGIRAVKSFVREDYEKQKFAKASDDVCDNFTRAEKLMALSSPLIQMAIYVVMLLICFLGAKTIITSGNTELTVGGLSSVMTYGMQVLMSLMMFTMIFVMITMSMASANRIVEVL
ncbi:MAG: ABC transporter ATP-binding protein, partial [Clostridia bacterium]|nr:ABC transporter ATP-binding protein [Clostridia bacterium]